VFVGATGDYDTNKVFAMDAANGDTLWYWIGSSGNAGGTMSSPVVMGEAVYIGTNWNGDANYDGCLCKFDYSYPGEGGPPYQPSNPYHYGIDCDVRGTPVVVGDVVYISSGRGLYGLDADVLTLLIGTGPGAGVQPGGVEEIWSSFGASVRPNASPPQTLLFIGEGGPSDTGRKVWCLDASLDTVWCYDTGRPVWSSPAVSDSMMFVTSDSGLVYCFKIQDNEERQGSLGADVPAPGQRGVCLKARAASGASSLSLAPSEPGRASGGMEIVYSLLPGEVAPVRLTILDAAGRSMRVLMAGTDWHGSHLVRWDGRGRDGRLAPSGVYFVRLETDKRQRVGRLLLIR
jgi:hypothetical protein